MQDSKIALAALFDRMQNAEHLEEIIYELEQQLLNVLEAERLTIYRKAQTGREIVSWYKSGEDMAEEIRLPLSPSSIAGYVAMSTSPLLLEDVYDTDNLSSIHPELAFDYSYDQTTGYLTTSMIAVPIKYGETLLGVMQVINRRDGGPFTAEHLEIAADIARALGQKFRRDLKSTVGPFDALMRAGKLSIDDLEEMEARAHSDNIPITILLDKELGIDPNDIGKSFEQYYQVPYFPFDENLEVANEFLDELNRDYLASQMWLPLAGNSDKAIILIDNPNNSDKIMEIQSLVGARNFEFLVGLPEDILRYLGYDTTFGPEEISEPEVGLDDLLQRLNVEGGNGPEDDGEISDLDESASTVVQLVNRVIYDGVTIGASDIHVEPSKGKVPAMVRMRVDGVCRQVLEVPHTHIRAFITRIKVMSRLDIAERRRPQSGKLAARMGGNVIEMRVECIPTVKGEGAVLRILSSGSALPFDKLNFSPRNEKMVLDVLDHPHGIILVVGPTGSGKTTSLHAILGHINTPERKIWTAEDPVEITQPGLCQVQAHPKIGLTFSAILRSFLRADPDVILIGEMRDEETAHAGIEASLTGHLVFSTLHTNSAPETITRLLDIGIDPMNFADALNGVVAQRLCRTLCGRCKEGYKPDEEELQKLVHLYGEDYFPELEIDLSEVELMRPVGCDSCSGTGYKGRTGVHEVALNNDEMRKMIITNAPVSDLKACAMKYGMRSLMQDGIYKIFLGQTDLTQLRKVTVG